MIPQGRAQLQRASARILEDADHRLSNITREILSESTERLKFIEARLHQYELHIERLFRQDPRCRRLAEVEGVGPLIATALVAAVGNAADFNTDGSWRPIWAWFRAIAPRVAAPSCWASASAAITTCGAC